MTGKNIPSNGPMVLLSGKAAPAVTTAILGPWAALALCAESDSEIFFPVHDDPGTEARQICSRCPVRDDCLSYAIAADERYGIWGGLDPDERRNLRRKQHRKDSKNPRARARGQGVA